MPLTRGNDGTTARSRAVVLVSGVLSHSPFTTPDAACATGLAAGNTDTFLREFLLEQGFTVFTAPQRAGAGPVEESDDELIGPFGACPVQPPASMTVDTTADIVEGGPRLLAFVDWLHSDYAVDEIDLVGHSLGGLLSRTLIGAIAEAGGPVRVRSLTTVGSPWEPPMLGNPIDPAVPTSACDGLEVCETFVDAIQAARPAIDPLLDRVDNHYEEWAESLAGTLDDLPVTVIGGSHFTRDGGDPDRWPNDGAIQLAAATAANVPARLLPRREVHVLPLTHSLFVSTAAGLDPATALTWSPEVGRIIADALRSAP